MIVIGVCVVGFLLVIFAIVEMHPEECAEYLREGFLREEGERRCLR